MGSPIPAKHAGLGIAVAKKLAKRAVDRNRLKRMIREIVRNTRKEVPMGQDIVIRLRKAVGQETRGRLREKERISLKKQIIGLI